MTHAFCCAAISALLHSPLFLGFVSLSLSLSASVSVLQQSTLPAAVSAQAQPNISGMASSRSAVTVFRNNAQKAYFAEALLVYSRRCFERLCMFLYPEEILNLVSSTCRLRATFLALPDGGGPPESTRLVEKCKANYNRAEWNFQHDRAVVFCEAVATLVTEATRAKQKGPAR